VAVAEIGQGFFTAARAFDVDALSGQEQPDQSGDGGIIINDQHGNHGAPRWRMNCRKAD
jgi:hypothetical protein